MEEDIPALMLAKSIKIRELVNKYGDVTSDKVFSLDDYKMYLLNNFFIEKYDVPKQLDTLIKMLKK